MQTTTAHVADRELELGPAEIRVIRVGDAIDR
jgi:hypothetical protein